MNRIAELRKKNGINTNEAWRRNRCQPANN